MSKINNETLTVQYVKLSPLMPRQLMDNKKKRKK